MCLAHALPRPACDAPFLERVRAGDVVRKGSWTDYVFLAVLTSSGMYMTNAALRYLNYTTRIVAKSSKVIPTMILGTPMQGRRYGYAEYAAAGYEFPSAEYAWTAEANPVDPTNPDGAYRANARVVPGAAASAFGRRAHERNLSPNHPNHHPRGASSSHGRGGHRSSAGRFGDAAFRSSRHVSHLRALTVAPNFPDFDGPPPLPNMAASRS